MPKKTLKEARAMGLIPKKEKVVEPVSAKRARRLIEFAQKHRCIITPVGYTYFVSGFEEFHRCPCAPERTSCPCEEAEIGRASCRERV